MATVQDWLLENRMDDEGFNLMKIVRDATWKDLLIDLVKRDKLDPWNVDIVEIVDKYIDAVKTMKVMDLRVPANIILAASILLRLKSEMMGFDEKEEQEEGSEIVGPRPYVNVEGLTSRLRLPPKRKITLNELITALDEAMKIKETREETVKRDSEIVMPLKFNDIDIAAEIEKLYAKLKQHVDSSNMITFSTLAKIVETDDILLGLFIPILFLANKNKVSLFQERFFEEIIITLN